jgi:predicted Fe-Mo cluster-binding NifX family protein
MKIAIPTVNDAGLESVVSEHFGRSAFFAIFDTETKEIHSVGNQGQHFGGSHRPAEVVANAATDVILCTNLGQKAFRYFQEREITVYTGASGKVRDVLRAHSEGRLQSATEAGSCPGRHG